MYGLRDIFVLHIFIITYFRYIRYLLLKTSIL